MNVLFIVQGEGKGHLTQAIALKEILEGGGHCVSAALVGTTESRPVPGFFLEAFSGTAVHTFASPALSYTEGAVDLKRTIRNVFRHLPAYRRSITYIRTIEKETAPDLIINFYEPVGGVYSLCYRHRPPVICIAHQYLLFHKDFPMPSHRWLDRQLVCLNTAVTQWGAAKILALSFRPMRAFASPGKVVMPPLLRQAVKETAPAREDFILIYLTHYSLSRHIEDWHKQHPDVMLKCFRDHPEIRREVRVDDTLTFYPVNAALYPGLMGRCAALATTAGFESACEALYLGKPLMMVPVANHFEQACNAADGALSGAVSRTGFDLSELCRLKEVHRPDAGFRDWADSASERFLEEAEETVYFHRPAENSVPVS